MLFTKMQGAGNDFVIVNGFSYQTLGDVNALAKRICDRHYGIGADGLIWVCPSQVAIANVRIFNSDGSEAETCGNGLRCAAKYLRDAGIARTDDFRIETLAGVVSARVNLSSVTVDMGVPCFVPNLIPVNGESNRIKISADDRELNFFCVSMGNPHAVTFDLFPNDDEFLRIAPKLECHSVFPNKANIEFCRIENGLIEVRVWERGDGATLACGSGACACLAAAAELGLTGREADMKMPGGLLHILWNSENHMIMTGEAKSVFTGDWKG